MKINLLDIKGFGKFNQLLITPEDGFNIVFESNESGKSTLQTFIRAMLYGLKGGRMTKEGNLPPLKKNKPWDGNQYAGIIEYTLDNGKSFRVGRSFDKGTTNIYDTEANNLTSDFPHEKDIGPKFAVDHLGIDEAVFEHSIFIGQLQSVIDEGGKKNIIEKMSNLGATGNEDMSLQQAVNALESTLLERVGTKNSTKRPLDIINNRISELKQERTDLNKQHEKYMDIISDLRMEKELLNDLKNELKEQNSNKEYMKKMELKALQRKINVFTDEINSLNDQINACDVELIELKTYENIEEDTFSEIALMHGEEKQIEYSISTQEARLKEMKERYDELADSLDLEELFKKKTNDVQEAIEEYNNSKSEIRNQRSRVVAKENNRIKRNWMPFFISASFLLVILITTYFFHVQNPLVLGAAIFLAFLTVTVSLRRKNRQSGFFAKQYTEADRLNDVLLKSGFTEMMDYIRYRESQIKGREKKESYVQQIIQIKGQIDSLINRKESIENRWNDFISKNPLTKGFDKEKVIDSIKRGVEGLKRTTEKKERLLLSKGSIYDKREIVLKEAGIIAGEIFLTSYELNSYISGIDQEEEAGVQQISAGHITESIKQTESKINEAELRIATLETRLENAPDQTETYKVIEELSNLRGKREDLELKGESLNLAIDILREVGLDMQRDYIPQLNREVSKMMGKLSSGKYRNVMTNDKLAINLVTPETEELVGVNSLSAGTIDQVYLSMRLAAVTIMEKGKEKLPLFLDEPFSQYDETRIRNAFQLLRDISKERQIFFFTCRQLEYDVAVDVFGQDLNRIRLHH